MLKKDSDGQIPGRKHSKQHMTTNEGLKPKFETHTLNCNGEYQVSVIT
jgi:hypothetical protein